MAAYGASIPAAIKLPLSKLQISLVDQRPSGELCATRPKDRLLTLAKEFVAA